MQKAFTREQARRTFETFYGSRISNSTWYRTLKIFSPEFPLTETNVRWLAETKRQLPKVSLQAFSVIEAMKQAQAFIDNQKQMSGAELLALFQQCDIYIHPNTLSRWFRPIHGFKRKRLYRPSELKPIVLTAYSYQLQRAFKDSIANFH